MLQHIILTRVMFAWLILILCSLYIFCIMVIWVCCFECVLFPHSTFVHKLGPHQPLSCSICLGPSVVIDMLLGMSNLSPKG